MPEDSAPLATRLCTRCGVAVAAGYVKCPRCHAELPLAVRRRALTDGGGTAVEAGLDRNKILIGVGAAAALVLVVWLVIRDDGSGKASPAPADDGAGEELAAPDEPDDIADEAPPDRAPTQPTQPQPAGVDRGAVVGELGRALRGERLWASVTAAGDTVVIDSSLCDDSGLGSIVDASAGDLRSAGFTQVRCKAPHGAIVFERGL